MHRDGSQAVIRVLALVQKLPLDPNGALAHFLDSAIDAGWSYYASRVLNIPDNLPQHQPYGYKYTGQLVSGGILSMLCTSTPPGDSQSLNEACALPKPTSRIIFDCDDSGSVVGADQDSYRNADSQGHKRLVSFMGAAINRGVFENYSDWADPSKFYTRPDGRYNHYSKIMHMFAVAQKVYGFGYDDVCGQDPTLAQPLDEVNQVVITIPNIPIL